MAELLRRNGLSTPRRWRVRRGHPGRPLTPMTAPNVIWTADYKGQFRLGDGTYCFPLTVQDGLSRYLLTCRGLTGTTTVECRPVFEGLFQEYANGGIRWLNGWVNVSHVLAGERVGFEEIDEGEWDLYFGRLKLGRFHEPLRRAGGTSRSVS